MNTYTFSQNLNLNQQINSLSNWVSSKQFKYVVFFTLVAVLGYFCLGEAIASSTTGIGGSGSGAVSGTGSGDFDTLLDRLNGWVAGSLGKALALLAFIVGLFFGAIKQNYIAALGGIAVALMIAIVPQLINSMISAGI